MAEKSLKEKDEIQYFEEEMHYLAKAGEEFAKKYPSVAGNLELTREGSSDPHVQQILESFAFLAGGLQKQIDGNSYILSRSLAETLYPNLAYPIPSMSVVELQVNASNPALLNPVSISRDTELIYTSHLNASFKFKTVYDTPLYPGEITKVKIDDGNDYDFLMGRGKKIISIGIKLFAGVIKKESARKIRFYINMRRIAANKIYDLIFNTCKEIHIYSSDDAHYKLGADSLSQVGFGEREDLHFTNKVTYDFSKTMQEFFLMPEKFMFFDLDGIDLDVVKKEFKILLVVESSDLKISFEKENIRLRCTPVINMFSLTSEPIKTRPEKNEYILYTNYLKNKFLFYHSIKKLKYLDASNKEHEIQNVKEYIYYKYENNEPYYYDIASTRADPNAFKINIYNNKNIIFIDEMTLYADIVASNGFFCEKMDVGERMNTVKETHVKQAELLRVPTYYIENDNSNEYYWSILSRLYSEKISFYDDGELLRDLKAIIKTRINVNLEKDNVKVLIDNISNLVESIEDAKIINKVFNIKKKKKHMFVRGKEIRLILNPSKILTESIVLLSETIFSILHNVVELNECVSLLMVEKSTQKVLYTCMPRNGTKKNL